MWRVRSHRPLPAPILGCGTVHLLPDGGRLMGDRSGIEWTDATWNPTTGCDRVSPGCDNCYALTMAGRLKAMGQPSYQNDGDPRTSGPGFALTLHKDRLDQPLRWTRPRRIFVNSMSDLFHPEVPDYFVRQVFTVMGLAGHHQFQVLTKRPQRMARHLGSGDRAEILTDGPLPNVWLGTSIESDKYVFRARHLAETPAAVRFLSIEPLLEDLPSLDLEGIDWVIVGGESGPGARHMHPAWVQRIRDLCQEQGVPFFFKQWGAWKPLYTYGTHRVAGFENVGKKKAGRELDGRTWSEYPHG